MLRGAMPITVFERHSRAGDEWRTPWPAYVGVNDRSERHEPVRRAVADERARELWRTTMPPGDPACLIVAYDGLGGRPPAR
jgi:hypothetical protein